MKNFYGKKLMMAALSIATTAIAWANPISENQAKTVASNFMEGKVLHSVSLQRAHKAPQQGNTAEAAYYVFNAESNQGYVIVAGDDCVPAVLGYSDNGAFDPNDVPEAMQQMLDYYAEQVTVLSGNDLKSPARLIARAAIAPLTTSIWGQSEPFNIYLPFTRTTTSDGVTRAWHGKVGCVATAMAQVMYYHKWPA